MVDVIVCANPGSIILGGAQRMKYVKAKDVLPYEIVNQIQQYISGEFIYIPKKADTKATWGQGTSTKTDLAERNAKIYSAFLNGTSITQLAKEYYLVEKSIQRIIRQEKKRV